MRGAIRVLGPSLLLAAVASAYADEPTFPGEWRTSLGIATFKMEGDTLVATFANPQISPVKGALKAKTATLEYREGPKRGDASLTLDDSGRSFSGWYRYGEGERNYPGTPWNGWRPDPEAARGETGRFDGLWLTTSGLMELEQTGDKVTGHYARYGPVKIDGNISGRRLDFHTTWLRNSKGWFDLSKDGKKIEGAAVADGTNAWYGWQGRRATEFRRHAPLAAGKIVDGSTKNLLTYCVRAPEGYKEGDDEALADPRHPPRLEYECQGLCGDPRVGLARHRPGLLDPGHQRRSPLGPRRPAPVQLQLCQLHGTQHL